MIPQSHFLYHSDIVHRFINCVHFKWELQKEIYELAVWTNLFIFGVLHKWYKKWDSGFMRKIKDWSTKMDDFDNLPDAPRRQDTIHRNTGGQGSSIFKTPVPLDVQELSKCLLLSQEPLQRGRHPWPWELCPKLYTQWISYNKGQV